MLESVEGKQAYLYLNIRHEMIQLYLLCTFDPPNQGKLFAIFQKYIPHIPKMEEIIK